MTDALKPRVLNARQEAFCQSYARYGNATRAAKEAGYSEKTAYTSGQRLTKDDEIRSRVVEIKAERFRTLHMSADEALAEIGKIARASMGAMLHITPNGDPYIDLNQADEDTLDAIAEATIEDFTDGREIDEEGKVIARDVRRVKIKMHNKIAALQLIARNHGLLKDRVEISVDDSFATKMEEAQRRAREARKTDENG